jgi:phosphate transport system permease protein
MAGGSEKLDENVPSLLISLNGGVVKVTEIGNTKVSGTVISPLANQNDVKPGEWRIVTIEAPETSRKLSDQQIVWLERLRERGLVSSNFATRFFTSGDSREAEVAGLLGGLVGSLLTMLVTLILCLPIGVGAAIYLEEFAPKNRLTDIIEVNINNLAAVPSIVFGLLGLALFLNTFDMPRSSPLVGGLVLALLVLPTIIIASRAALKAVPPSIREAALGVGASHQQAVFHHVLPLAMPGILTGTIIGMAHALGETAPLLMIGMVAFIVEVPKSLTESATVLPVQIFIWSDLPEAAFQAKTAGAIIVLLIFLFLMNGAAIWLRKKFERRW